MPIIWQASLLWPWGRNLSADSSFIRLHPSKCLCSSLDVSQLLLFRPLVEATFPSCLDCCRAWMASPASCWLVSDPPSVPAARATFPEGGAHLRLLWLNLEKLQPHCPSVSWNLHLLTGLWGLSAWPLLISQSSPLARQLHSRDTGLDMRFPNLESLPYRNLNWTFPLRYCPHVYNRIYIFWLLTQFLPPRNLIQLRWKGLET